MNIETDLICCNKISCNQSCGQPLAKVDRNQTFVLEEMDIGDNFCNLWGSKSCRKLSKIKKKKKVLLRERKRHTDRRVASTRYAAPGWGGTPGRPPT